MTSSPHAVRGAKPALAIASLTVAIAGALVSGSAAASGFQLKENSAKALGRSFAGTTAGPADLSVVANNPAAMTDLEGTQFKLGTTVIQLNAEFSGSGQTIGGQPLTGGNGGNGGGVIPVPAAFYATAVGENDHLGVSLTVPYGFTTEYDPDWIGRYKAVKSHLQTLALTVSWSHRFSDSFSLGASAIGYRSSADLTSQVDYGTFLGVPQQADGLARITGDSLDFGWQLGAVWDITENNRLALNYRAEVDQELEGNATFHDVPIQLAALQELGNFINTDGTAALTLPSNVNLSYWFQATDSLGLGLEVARTGWSSFDELRVEYGSAQDDTVEPEHWEDTWMVGIGGDYRLNDNWVLRAGVGYDETPTQDATRSPRVPGNSRRWASVGFDYQPSDTLEVSVGFAHLWVSDPLIENTLQNGTAGPTGTSLVGTFSEYANLLAASATYKF